MRYPKYHREEDLLKFEKPVSQIVEALTPYRDSAEAINQATKDIYNILKDYYDKAEHPEDQTKNEGEDGEGGGEQPKGKKVTKRGGSKDDQADFEQKIDEIASVINDNFSPSHQKGEDIEMADYISYNSIEAEVLQGSPEKGSDKDTFFCNQPNS